jgi:hypothetical protein
MNTYNYATQKCRACTVIMSPLKQLKLEKGKLSRAWD